MVEQTCKNNTPVGVTPSQKVNPASHKMAKKELAKVAESELGETKTTRTKALKELRQWISSEGSRMECLKDASDSFLLRFLRMQKTDVKKASTVLDNYIRFRTNTPEWFENLDIKVRERAILILENEHFLNKSRS